MIGSRFIMALLLAGAASAASAQAPAQPAAVVAQPRQVLLAKITVSDLPKSYAFYTQVIGLKRAVAPGMPIPAAPSASDVEREFVEIPMNFSGSFSEPLLVLVKQRGARPTPESAKLVWIGFKVPSARAALEQAAKAGHKSLRGDPGAGPRAYGFIADPDGYTVELIQSP